MTKYKHLMAWCQMMGSYQYYIDAQIEEATRDNAPEDAIFKDGKGVWHQYANVTNVSTRHVIDDILERMGGENG
jgi:hypothetical protein